MNLADDLRILNALRVPYKSALIKFVAHLYTKHPNAMDGINGKTLMLIAYSQIDMETIAEILENDTPMLKEGILIRIMKEKEKESWHDL